MMKIGTIDQESRIRLVGTHPKERFWVIEQTDGYRLKRVAEPKKRMSKQDVLKALRTSKLRFTRDWEEIRQDTRER